MKKIVWLSILIFSCLNTCAQNTGFQGHNTKTPKDASVSTADSNPSSSDNEKSAATAPTVVPEKPSDQADPTRAQPYRYYRLYIDTIPQNNDGSSTFSVISELKLRDATSGWLTNQMTSNNSGTIGGKTVLITSSSAKGSGFEAFRAFDGNALNNAFWSSTQRSCQGASTSYTCTPPAWVQIDLGENGKRYINAMELDIFNENHIYIMPRLTASNDGSNWENIPGATGYRNSCTVVTSCPLIYQW